MIIRHNVKTSIRVFLVGTQKVFKKSFECGTSALRIKPVVLGGVGLVVRGTGLVVGGGGFTGTRVGLVVGGGSGGLGVAPPPDKSPGNGGMESGISEPVYCPHLLLTGTLEESAPRSPADRRRACERCAGCGRASTVCS